MLIKVWMSVIKIYGINKVRNFYDVSTLKGKEVYYDKNYAKCELQK